MKASYVFLIAAWGLFLAGCTNDLESGKDYPALAMGTETVTFKIDKVLQNDVDVKPYFTFFDDVELLRERQTVETDLLRNGSSVQRSDKRLHGCRLGNLHGQKPLRNTPESHRRGNLLHNARQTRHISVQAGSPFEQIRIPAASRSK